MSKILNLCLEGGGAKGSAFIGALKAFDMVYPEWVPGTLVGTSAGAITAALLAVGYRAADFEDLAREKTPDGKPVFSTFLDRPSYKNMTRDGWFVAMLAHYTTLGRELYALNHFGGVFAGEAFYTWIKQKLSVRGFNDPTFKDVYDVMHTDLRLIVTDRTNAKRLVLSKDTCPDCHVSHAVRMSMSIPFVWEECHWHAEDNGLYMGDTLHSSVLVDGGVVCNFALDVLMRECIRADSLGLLLDETQFLFSSDHREPWVLDLLDKNPVIRRGLELMDALMAAGSDVAMASAPDRVIKLPCGGVGTLDFNLPDKKLDILINSAQTAALKFLYARTEMLGKALRGE